MTDNFFAYASVGAITGAVITMFSTHILKTHELKVKILEDKLNKLYGPIYYYTKLNLNFFNHKKVIHDSWNTQYNEPTFSEDQLTQDRLIQADQDMDYFQRKYQEQILANNEQIKLTLDNNFSLIDTDDVDVFLQFYLHRTRLLIEVKNEENIKVPPRMRKSLSGISFMPTEFSDRVEEKFKRKKKKLDKMKWWKP